MKKVLLTLVIGMMTIVGFGQVVRVHVEKMQDFEHTNQFSTQDAAENGSLVYTVGGRCNGNYIFNLDRMVMSLEWFEENGNRHYNEYKIVGKNQSSNLVDVIVIDENNERCLFVLGNTIKDNGHVLIMNKHEGNKITGFFYPDSIVEIIKK